jgi:predicted ribosome quality control (RQC) complex YloA/Tae2 family protein
MEFGDTGDQIEELEARLRARLKEIEDQLRPLQSEAAKLRAQLELVTKLLHVTKADGTPVESPQQASAPAAFGSGKTVADNVAEVLVAAGQPLHISQIRDNYLKTGRTIPGKGTYVNLLAYMVRDPRFVRVAKGTYALSGKTALPAKSAKRRRRRRRQ